MSEVEVTDEMVERMARTLFAQTIEARNGFSWPPNGGVYREHDMELARKALLHVLGATDHFEKGTCGACGEKPYGHDNFECEADARGAA